MRKFWLGCLGLTVVLLLSLVTVTSAAPLPRVSLTFEGEKFASDSEVQAIEANKTKYVNLQFLIERMHIVTSWNTESGEIVLKFGKFDYKLRENELKYTKNKETGTLKNAPFAAEEQLWFPVEFLTRLKLKVVSETTASLNLAWQEQYILAVEPTTYDGRPAFTLVGTAPFNIDSFLLTNPDRLVLDMNGFKAHPSFDVEAKYQLVKAIRFFQFRADAFRVVFDLNRLGGYQLIQDPDNVNQTIVIFNYFVEGVELKKHDGAEKMYLRTSFPAKFTVKNYKNPNRLVLDFEGASISLKDFKGPSGGSTAQRWLKSIRTSQFAPNIVRVVVDLQEGLPSFVMVSPDDPNLLEIRTIQFITGISCNNLANSSELMVDSDGQLSADVKRDNENNKLLVDFRYTGFLDNLELPKFSNSQVKDLKVVKLDDNTARLEIDMQPFISYETQYSPERSSMKIIFKLSPLIGKLIVIDPGHGGVDIGATGKRGTREKNVNFDVSLRLKDNLEAAGAQVVLTRTDDVFISLYERSLIANNVYADAFVSVHSNAHIKPEINGIEVYYFSGRSDSMRLAGCVEKHLPKLTGLTSLGLKQNDFVVIREAQMPSILVELGYLSNYAEEKRMLEESFRVNASQAIFLGVSDYFENESH